MDGPKDNASTLSAFELQGITFAGGALWLDVLFFCWDYLPCFVETKRKHRLAPLQNAVNEPCLFGYCKMHIIPPYLSTSSDARF